MSMKIDFSDFTKGFETFLAKSPDELGKGLFRAASLMLEDACEYEPHAPRDSTALWLSKHIKGSGAKLHKASAENEPEGFKAEIKAGEIGVSAGFNVPYAARWHEISPAEERKISWTLSGSGRKYLEKKMVSKKNDYIELVQKYWSRVFKGKS